MKKKNYKRLFNLFVKDVKKIKNSSFVNIDNWKLSDDLDRIASRVADVYEIEVDDIRLKGKQQKRTSPSFGQG